MVCQCVSVVVWYFGTFARFLLQCFWHWCNPCGCVFVVCSWGIVSVRKFLMCSAPCALLLVLYLNCCSSWLRCWLPCCFRVLFSDVEWTCGLAYLAITSVCASLYLLIRCMLAVSSSCVAKLRSGLVWLVWSRLAVVSLRMATVVSLKDLPVPLSLARQRLPFVELVCLLLLFVVAADIVNVVLSWCGCWPCYWYQYCWL